MGGEKQSIDDVLAELDNIIQWAQENNSVLGYFPALYRKVTAEVKQKISQGYFEDGPRMERLDVIFANRYLEAYHNFTKGQPLTHSWKRAFFAKRGLLVFQHLLLGMNAHINLDLGVACARAMEGEDIELIREDFVKINQLLIDKINEVQNNLAQISPLFKFLDIIGGRTDERFAGFSLKAARQFAWQSAIMLHGHHEDIRKGLIETQDRTVGVFARLISHPGFFTKFILMCLKIFESRDIQRNIQVLR